MASWLVTRFSVRAIVFSSQLAYCALSLLSPLLVAYGGYFAFLVVRMAM